MVLRPFLSSHLRFLAKKFPKETIKIIYLNKNQDFWREIPDFNQSQTNLNFVNISEAKFKSLSIKSLGLFFSKQLDKLTKSIFNIDDESFKQLSILKNLINKDEPIQFIWCEHLLIVLYFFLIISDDFYIDKLIYSHHDFLFKILRKRAHSPRQWLRSCLVRRLEKLTIEKIKSFVSGSQSELQELRLMAPNAHQFTFLPCFYPPPQKNRKKQINNVVKIYHIGTAGATANKIGIKFFLTEVFPAIENLSFTLEFIGDVKDYVLHNFPQLKNHPKIIFHGFVKNLDEKIENNMIHIIPY
jgi:hypothetical protein